MNERKDSKSLTVSCAAVLLGDGRTEKREKRKRENLYMWGKMNFGTPTVLPPRFVGLARLCRHRSDLAER